MAHNPSEDASARARASGSRRWAVRIFVFLVVAMIAIDVAPERLPGVRAAKRLLPPALKWVGLWQGEWPLFAPNPLLNNGWFSAEFHGPDGQTRNWNSPYWAAATTSEKFRMFRHLNYYTALPVQTQGVLEDFCDFLARQELGSTARPVVGDRPAGAEPAAADGMADGTWRMSLYHNRLNMSIPEDGSLPKRDDVIWISTSRRLVDREYLP